MKEPHNSKITGKKNLQTYFVASRQRLIDRCKKQTNKQKTAIYENHKQVLQKKRNKMSTLQSFPKGKYAASCVKWKQARMFVKHTLINIFPGSGVICTRPRNSDMS